MKASPCLVSLLRDLIAVRTENPPGNERELADHLRGFLRRHSIPSSVDVVAPGRANVVACIGGTRPGPVLAFNGHLDTVPVRDAWTADPFHAAASGRRIVGLGAADMKGAVAAMVIAAMEARKHTGRMKGSLLLVFVADEERTNLGTLDFLRRYPGPDYVVIGEPTGLDLVTSNRGTLRLRITSHGVAGHSSNPRAAVNSIYPMAAAVTSLEKYAARLDRGKQPYTSKPSLSVTLIHGGTGENVIPAKCELTVDRRLVFGENTKDVEREILGILPSRGRSNEGRPYSCERIDSMEPWHARRSSPLVEYCIQAYRECFRSSAVCRDLGGTSEAGLFARKGIDTVIFGPGSISQAHTKDEFVEISQLEKAVAFYTGLIRTILLEGGA